jgi:hypothetical protein
MIFLLTIPFIVFFTFRSMIASGFPNFPGEPRGFLSWIFMVIVSCFFTGIISLIPFGIACWIGSLPKRTGKFDKDYPLIALRQKDGISGKFFLGSGTVNDEQYYFWYRKESDHISGGKTIRSSGVRIYEGDYSPFMRTYKDDYLSPKTSKYIWIVGIDMRGEDNYLPDFYIPSGSIQEGFSL